MLFYKGSHDVRENDIFKSCVQGSSIWYEFMSVFELLLNDFPMI